MRIHLVDDDATFLILARNMLSKSTEIELSTSASLSGLGELSSVQELDLILLDVVRPGSAGIEDDMQRVRALTQVPVIFITYGDTSRIRDDAIASGAEAVVDKETFSVGLIRQLALNAMSRGRADDRSEKQLEVVSKDITALGAPLAYIESGLSTLSEVMADTGKDGSREFVDHLRETIQAIKQYSEDDLSQEYDAKLHTFMEQSWERIRSLAETRKVGLGVDWERAGFKQIGSDALVRLGIQHLLEGVLRCCHAKDAIWVQAEKADENGASVIRVHMSRVVLPSADIMFPGVSSTKVELGLDALSSLQLGALLLLLSPRQVSLQSEKKQQLLSIYL